MTAPAAQKPNVATPSKAYDAAAAAWALPRALSGGTAAMRAAGKTYLPQEPAESPEAYTHRLARTTLFNAYAKTRRDMSGKVFAEPIVLQDDVPEQLKGYAENIDLAGRNLDNFAHAVFVDAFDPGVSYILADMPPAVEGATRADEIAAGRRPYLVHIRAEDLIGWQSQLIAGQETLTQVRLRECVTEPGEYDGVEITQIRVLTPGAWQVWRKPDPTKDEWALFDEGTTSLSYIPLSPVYLNRTGFMQGAPALQDLADLNVAHWQSQSDQRNILHVARVPILFGAGIPDDVEGQPGFKVSAGSFTRATDPNAKLMFVEHSGAAIGAGDADLKNLEFQMQAMGLQLLIPQPGGKTATGVVADDVKENSPLAMMAASLQDALEAAFGFLADFDGLGRDAGGSLKVNKSFGLSIAERGDLQTLVAAVAAGDLTRRTFLEELKRRGTLADDLDVDDEIERLQTEAPTLTGTAIPLPAVPA